MIGKLIIFIIKMFGKTVILMICVGIGVYGLQGKSTHDSSRYS